MKRPVSWKVRAIWRLVTRGARFRRRPRYSDFIRFEHSGAISVDLWGWWRTEPGKKELDKQLADMRKFEAYCRANSPDGSFSFYD